MSSLARRSIQLQAATNASQQDDPRREVTQQRSPKPRAGVQIDAVGLHGRSPGIESDSRKAGSSSARRRRSKQGLAVDLEPGNQLARLGAAEPLDPRKRSGCGRATGAPSGDGDVVVGRSWITFNHRLESKR
jgi:hypothetical protein